MTVKMVSIDRIKVASSSYEEVYIFGLSEKTKAELQRFPFNIKAIVDNDPTKHQTYYKGIIPIIAPHQITDDINTCIILWGNHLPVILKQVHKMYEKCTVLIDEKSIFQLENKFFTFTIDSPWFFEDRVNDQSQQVFISNVLKILIQRNLSFKFNADHGLDIFETKKVSPNEILLSYHTVGEADPNIIRFKNSYLPDYVVLDSLGYSGWHSLAYKTIQNHLLDLYSPEKLHTFHDSLYEKYVNGNLSFYQQPDFEAFIFPEEFVFFPLQVLTDSVMKLSRFNPLYILQYIADLLHQMGISLVVKPHPKCFDIELNLLIDKLEYDKKIIVYKGSIHDAISKSSAVYVINSGVGFEALMHLKPVVTFGEVDYNCVAFPVNDLAELKNRLLPKLDAEQVLRIKAFLHYYVKECLVPCDDLDAIDRVVSKAIFEATWSFKINENIPLKEQSFFKRHAYSPEIDQRLVAIGFPNYMIKYLKQFFNNANIYYLQESTPNHIIEDFLAKYSQTVNCLVWKDFYEQKSFLFQLPYDFFLVQEGSLSYIGPSSSELNPFSLFFDTPTYDRLVKLIYLNNEQKLDSEYVRKKIIQMRKHKISKYSLVDWGWDPYWEEFLRAQKPILIVGDQERANKFGKNYRFVKKIRSLYPSKNIVYIPSINILSPYSVYSHDHRIDEDITVLPATLPLGFIFDYITEIHVMNSDIALDGLLYDKSVFCHDKPWYLMFSQTIQIDDYCQINIENFECFFKSYWCDYPIYFNGNIDSTLDDIIKKKSIRI